MDHDYCSSIGSALSSSESSNEYERLGSSDNEKCISLNKDDGSRQSSINQATARSSNLETVRVSAGRKLLSKYYGGDSWTDHNSKKDSGLESGDVSDASEELQPATKVIKKEVAIEQPKEQLQENSLLKQTNVVPNKINQSKSVVKQSPVHEMKIRSALATSILQLRKGVLTKTKPVIDIGNGRKASAYIVGMEGGNPKVKQMISVLKKPPASSPALTSNPNESIVTTTNSSNSEVQNIIVQECEQQSNKEEAKKPARRKLNLAEYRSRRDKNRSDNSRTNSPIQPMTLIYIHHVSTTTEPIKDDPENPVWSEREIVSVLKPKAEIEEEKNRPKPTTQDTGIQTNETVFDSPAKTNNVNSEQRCVVFRVCTSLRISVTYQEM